MNLDGETVRNRIRLEEKNEKQFAAEEEKGRRKEREEMREKLKNWGRR